MSNPYDSPQGGFGQPMGGPPMGAPPANVGGRVKGPAIGIIVAMALGILHMLWGILSTFIMGEPDQQTLDAMQQMGMDPVANQGINIISSLVGIAIGAFVLFGAIQMMNLRMWGLALAACIVAIIPCPCCCFVGAPFGIWGIVVLLKPEVKAAFR